MSARFGEGNRASVALPRALLSRLLTCLNVRMSGLHRAGQRSITMTCEVCSLDGLACCLPKPAALLGCPLAVTGGADGAERRVVRAELSRLERPRSEVSAASRARQRGRISMSSQPSKQLNGRRLWPGPGYGGVEDASRVWWLGSGAVVTAAVVRT